MKKIWKVEEHSDVKDSIFQFLSNKFNSLNIFYTKGLMGVPKMHYKSYGYKSEKYRDF
jgi:hypothetical protein